MVAEVGLVVAEGLTADRWEAEEVTAAAAAAAMDRPHHTEAAEGTFFSSHFHEMNRS